MMTKKFGNFAGVLSELAHTGDEQTAIAQILKKVCVILDQQPS
jgi:hypothetical protein